MDVVEIWSSSGRALVEEKPGAKTERRNKNRIAKAGPSAGIGRPPSPATLCLLPIAPSRNGAVGAATGSGLIKSGFLRYFATFDIVYNSVNEQHYSTTVDERLTRVANEKNPKNTGTNNSRVTTSLDTPNFWQCYLSPGA
ncbi:hypothetical protein Q1695_000994 [Nippostrongylus brasiliensis]|nr:hypothetical protein Q1695_000994 [Nippostrongylus brasiliensis]